MPKESPLQMFQLAPCGPFVQGFVQLPVQPCCDGLKQVYSEEPTCLYLFVNNTSNLSPAFPINQTLVVQLPPLCNILADSSSSSSTSLGREAPSDSSTVASPPSTSTGSQKSQGAKNKSGVAGKASSPECFNICKSKQERLTSQYESVDFRFTISATPVAQVAARPTSFVGLGYGLSSSASKSKRLFHFLKISNATSL